MSAVAWIFIFLLICVVIVFLGFLFYSRKAHIKSPQKPNAPNTRYRSAEEIQGRQNIVRAMYVPKDVGHRTGQERVFMTSKGLRSYEVSTDDLQKWNLA